MARVTVVLPTFNKRENVAESLESARSLGAQLLFCDVEILPPGDEPLPPGPWRWAVYTIGDPALARGWGERGASFVETDDIGGLLESDEFARGDRS